MADTVNLVIYPEVQEGVELEAVKQKLCKTLSVDAATVDTWYATEQPTAILKDVDEATATKYVEAIKQCGAQCNLQPSGEDKSGWSLEQMTKADIRDLFICPSCEHEEQLERGGKLEQCPECGLVIAKWEEKMREEAEKEKIRRRLMRDQRLKGDREAELDAKKKELERLKALELEIMKELGIRPPSQLWMIFERYTISLSFAITAVIIMATGVAFRYVDNYLDQMAAEELAAAAPSQEIQGIAPVVASAIELQQNGNGQVMSELANVTQQMHGAQNESRQQIVQAAQQMMKGVDPGQFIAAAGQMALPKMNAKLSAGEIEPAPVNIDTIGGVSGLQGISNFTPTDLTSMAPPLLEHGHEQVLSVLTEKRVIRDAFNPEAPDIIVDAIDEMDGSAIVELMSSISKDQEWDQYMLSHVREYVMEGDIESAEKLADRIKNPVVRIQGFGVVMEQHVLDENAADLKVLNARVRLDLQKIEDADARARVILELGHKMAAAGSEGEPYAAMEKVSALAADAEDRLEESYLTSRLAVAYLKVGDNAQAKRMLTRATGLAGQIPELPQRISAFTRIAQRYYDARNLTLAAEILSEASIIAATELEQQERSVAFGEIAVAQAYTGDFEGARMSIDNAGEGEAKQQLIAKVAESLIGEGRYYEALSWMETLTDETEYSRLELRLSSALYYAGRTREALNRMEQSAPRMQRIYELSERGLLTSQYARLFSRLGREDRANDLFNEAEKISEQLTGRKAQVNLALSALDRARVFQVGRAKYIMTNEVTDTVVKDPIDTEILSTERIIKNLLPADLYAEEEGDDVI
jgi:tetratricopeptide (TPR) repeat protein